MNNTLITTFQSVILIASLVKQAMSPAEYTTYLGCDDSQPIDPKNWTVKVPFPDWAQVVGALMVMLPVVPMPVLAFSHLIRSKHRTQTNTDNVEEANIEMQ